MDGWKLKWLYMETQNTHTYTKSTANKQKMEIVKCVTAVTSCCLPYLVDLILYFSPFLSLSLPFLKKQRLNSSFTWTPQPGRLGLQRHPVAALRAFTSSAWPPSLQWFIVSLRLLLCDVWFSTELRPNTERLRIDSYWSVMGGRREGAMENKGLADPF